MRESEWEKEREMEEKEKEKIGYSLFTALKGFIGLMVFGWILSALMK